MKLPFFKILILLPLIILLSLIRIFFNFRINKVYSKKIGHMATPMEIYICEKKEGLKSPFVIWFFEKRIANQFLKKKWSQKLFIMPHQIMAPIYILFNRFKFFNFFLFDTSKYSKEVTKYRFGVKGRLKQIDDNNILLRQKPTIKFNDSEINKGENYLKKIGFHKNKFFIFAARTSDFHKEKTESTRNCDINDQILGVKYLISKGFRAIRFGKNETKKINFNDSNIIDYATSDERSDFLDVYLASKCEFMISSVSGVTEFATLFRKPKLFINYFDIQDMSFDYLKLIILPKKVKNLRTGKFISFQEIYQKKLTFINDPIELKSLGYVAVDNTKLEIQNAAESFYNLINNRINVKDTLRYQKNFWQNLEKFFGFENKNGTIVCPHFYLNNIQLFSDNNK